MKIICIDIETTGLDKAKDRILQLATRIFDPEKELRPLVLGPGKLTIGPSRCWLIKPTGYYNIAESAQAIHGITREQVEESGVSLASIYDTLMGDLGDLPILTYNGTTFDLAFLEREFEREQLDLHLSSHQYIDSYDIEKRNHSNRLVDVYRRYYGADFEDAHNALADVDATIAVYKAQLKGISPDILKESGEAVTTNSQVSPEGFVKMEDGNLLFAVGKYKGISVSTVCKNDPGYIKWLFNPRNGDNIITIPTKSAIKEDYNNHKIK